MGSFVSSEETRERNRALYNEWKAGQRPFGDLPQMTQISVMTAFRVEHDHFPANEEEVSTWGREHHAFRKAVKESGT
jgi:hypothetical protein